MFLTTEVLTQTSWVLTFILLPASRGSVIFHDSNLGVTRVLFAEWPLPDGAVGHRQLQSKSPSAHTEPKPMNIARGWISWLLLGAAWMFPPCVWIRAGPHPPSSTHCENTFGSVNKRCSKTVSRFSKGWVFRPLSKLALHWESTKFHNLNYLGVSKGIYPRLCQYLLAVRLNIPCFASEDGKHFSFALHVLLCSCPCL